MRSFFIPFHQQQEEQQERLHENIEELKDLIKEAKRRYREEKKRRRKMDNAVTKLSHELTRRDQQSKVGQQRIKEMEDENLHLEQDWTTMLEERDLIVRDQNDFGGNYQLQIAEEKAKYQTLLQQHEMALSEMKRNHQHQCHNLCELILKADREADQLRQQLQGDHNEALPSPKAFRSADNESRSKFRLFTRKALVSVLITLLGILYYKGNQVELFTKDGMCSPIIPGRVLTAQTGSNAMRFEAPWWAPVSMKQSAFTKLCINQSNAFLEDSFFSPVVEWKDPDKKGGRFKNQQKSLVITTAEGNENVKCSEAERVEFSGTKILVWCQTGKKTTIEEIAFPYR
mmetsp:Transcript_28630/g.53824  ORF Transcript_28630/g.53824 Transcript_28630/m.53824 type:complete len:343 (-) Transcript_28630:99-1127(-)